MSDFSCRRKDVGMRTGFFGGSFDPPHRGHLAVARAAQKAFALDRLLLAPTASQPLKRAAHAPFADRLEMVRLLCLELRGCEASTLDSPRADGHPNYTIDTLQQLRQLGTAGDDIFLIVGADAFLDIRRWRASATLLVSAEWIVVTRPGFVLGKFEALELSIEERERVHVLNDVDDAVSATDVRARLLAGKDCSEMVPPQVLSYIRAHGLYGTWRAST